MLPCVIIKVRRLLQQPCPSKDKGTRDSHLTDGGLITPAREKYRPMDMLPKSEKGLERAVKENDEY